MSKRHPSEGQLAVVAVWLGCAPPIRSIRWLDGALATATKFGPAIALAAGDRGWLDLATDRAMRAGVASCGVETDLKLDYLGWAQIVAGLMRTLELSTLIVDEASRRERFAEVAAIADLLDAVQLTHVVALAPDGPIVRASRVLGRELHTFRVKGPAVFGVRIAGEVIDEYPTPTPSSKMRRFDLAALGLDASALGHRAVPPRAQPHAKKSIERIADHLSVHLKPRGT